MRRSKNIEPGLTPRFESDSLESEWGPAVSSVDEHHDPPYGMLEFDTCDAGFIDNQQLDTPTTREEIYFPSAGEVAFASEQEMEIAHAEMLDLLKSNVGLEGVIGNDDRVWVRDTRDQRYPWARKICSLIVTTQAGQRLRGTGWIAGPRLILTAAHNLYIHERGGWPSSVTVIPGRNGFRAPYSYFNVSASNLIVTRGWHHRKELATDLGAIVIPKPTVLKRAIFQSARWTINGCPERGRTLSGTLRESLLWVPNGGMVVESSRTCKIRRFATTSIRLGDKAVRQCLCLMANIGTPLVSIMSMSASTTRRFELTPMC